LTIALKNPVVYRSVSAFAPICAPMEVPWGRKAFSGYLGDDQSAWAAHDACGLVRRGPYPERILIDQGSEDQFLAQQLRPELFQQACESVGQALQLRMQDGYDHSYYFIQTFVGDHLAHHAAVLSSI
jgi:S-formylglutathione hydrolase